MRGLDKLDLASGDRYLKLHHYADPEKDDQWLEQVKREMSATPATFRLQILMQDEQAEGALWSREWFDVDGFRLPPALFMDKSGKLIFKPPVELTRVVVAIDPTSGDPERRRRPDKELDACGLGVAGVTADLRFVVLGDFSDVMKPGDWGRLAVMLYGACNANMIVAESNQGGEMVREVLEKYAHNIPLEMVTASTGKRARAEPVAVMYEQGMASHCGPLDALEDEMVTWDASSGAPSPNRIDWVAWAAHALGLCTITGRNPISRLRINR